MSKLLIRRCAYCNEEFFTENPRRLYCYNACTCPAIRVRNLFKAYPVKSLGNWDSVGDIEMGEVIERYAEPIEALLDLPARAPIQGMTAAKVLDWIRDTSKGKYSFLEEDTDGKTA